MAYFTDILLTVHDLRMFSGARLDGSSGVTNFMIIYVIGQHTSRGFDGTYFTNI